MALDSTFTPGVGWTVTPIVAATGGVPPGGTTDEVLKKNSNTDGDADWAPVTVPDNSIDSSKLATIGTKVYLGRSSAGTGVVEGVPVAQLATDLGVDGKADVLAPVIVTTATTLNRATHGNRQILFGGADAVLTIDTDLGGGWTADDAVEIHTNSGSVGNPTLLTPDGKQITGTVEKVIGAVRKGTNSWTLGSTNPQTAPEGVIDSAFGYATPRALGDSVILNIGVPSAAVMDGSSLTATAASTDPAGHRPRTRVLAAASAINRCAGITFANSFRGDVGGLFNGGFPIIMEAAASDATAAASFFMGMQTNAAPTQFTTNEPSAIATADMIGLGWDSTGANSSNLGIIYNDNVSTPTYFDLGLSFAKAQGQLFRLILTKNAAGTIWFVTAVKVLPGGQNVRSPTYQLTTNIPRPTQQMFPTFARSSMASVAQVSIDFAGYTKGRLA